MLDYIEWTLGDEAKVEDVYEACKSLNKRCEKKNTLDENSKQKLEKINNLLCDDKMIDTIYQIATIAADALGVTKEATK